MCKGLEEGNRMLMFKELKEVNGVEHSEEREKDHSIIRVLKISLKFLCRG